MQSYVQLAQALASYLAQLDKQNSSKPFIVLTTTSNTLTEGLTLDWTRRLSQVIIDDAKQNLNNQWIKSPIDTKLKDNHQSYLRQMAEKTWESLSLFAIDEKEARFLSRPKSRA